MYTEQSRLLKFLSGLRTFFEDIFFSTTPSQLTVEMLSSNDLFPHIRTYSVSSHRTFLSYEHTMVRALLWEAKFSHNQKAFDVLGSLLANYLKHHRFEKHILVAVPLAKERERERGYNQITEILNASQKIIPELIINTKLIKKVQHTPPQTTLQRADRLKNLNDAFMLNTKESAQIQNYYKNLHQDTPRLLIIDDITTTGATLREIKKVVKGGGFAATTLALAH